MYLSIDEGTTNVKSVLFDENFAVMDVKRLPLRTYFPREGWVEQDPEDIWGNVRRLVLSGAERARYIAITNQRETTVLWSAETGKPVHNAIVWSCRRTADMVNELKEDYGEWVMGKTGLEMDAYFSASKIRWIMENVPGVEELARRKKLRFGTVDTYLIWKLTGGSVHATDHTNASRTMLYNLRDGWWDEELLELFGVPDSLLPDIRDSNANFGEYAAPGRRIPIVGVAGDQQSALLAHGCQGKGETKVTYGTGTFMLVNTGAEILRERGLISTVAWAVDSERSFAMEGSILSSGTVVEWLKSVGLWSDNVGEETSLHFVPAFFGLGSPYWDPYARGLILGITPYTSREHITRAALESIAFMVADILHMISKHVSMPFIRADGGMSANEFLMQFQSDILGIPVQVPEFGELTALGAAMLSAVGAGERDMEEIRDVVRYDREYIPEKPAVWRERRMERWHEAVRRSMGWGGASWEN